VASIQYEIASVYQKLLLPGKWVKWPEKCDFDPRFLTRMNYASQVVFDSTKEP
jgi:hypothetical protein